MSKTIIVVEGKVTIKEEKPKTHLAFTLTDYDKKLLIECVKSRFNEVQKILEYYDESSEVEKIRNDAFDLQGLLAMIKEGEQIKSVIPKARVDAGWTFLGHNVDMPRPYTKGEGLKDDMVEEVSI